MKLTIDLALLIMAAGSLGGVFALLPAVLNHERRQRQAAARLRAAALAAMQPRRLADAASNTLESQR